MKGMSAQMKRCSDHEIVSDSEEHTLRIGELMARHVFPGLVILLEGELGTGKTTLVRGYCRQEGFLGVRSPSFTLVNRYSFGEKSVVHSDLYRLNSVDPTELDMESYLDEKSVLFVEWADRGMPGDFEDIWRICIRYEDEYDDQGRRALSFSARGPRAESALEALLNDLEEMMSE